MADLPIIEAAEIAVRYARAHGIPVIVNVSDLWPDLYLRAVPRFLRGVARLALFREFRMVRQVMRGASALTAVSPSYLRWALKHARRERRPDDAVFYLGYDSRPGNNAAATSDSLTRFGISETSVVCLFVGNFGFTYDLETVIRAAAIIEASHPHVHFVLCGDGDRLVEWTQLARGLKNVHFTGWIHGDELGRWLSRADVGLAAYSADAPQSLPNKVFEYLSAGVPMLSSLHGDLDELLRATKTGLTYEPHSVDSFLGALKELLGAPAETRAMRARARALFEERFEQRRICREIVSYIEGHARKSGIVALAPANA